MASWMVHLRIADELLPRLKHIDETAFIVGNMAPDSGVPNADWSEFHPPSRQTHFKTKTERGSFIDVDRFCGEYLNDEAIRGYDTKAYSFFLGYYSHLLTDIRWTKTVYAALLREHPEEYAADKSRLVQTAKEDWYDLDFLYLEQNPAFRAFRTYENAAPIVNTFMDMFSEDAFENRRQYICGFYHSDEHGALHRAYRYLTPERADAFVKETAKWIPEQGSRYFAVG